jgi:chemotaxis protein methyltransferase CheR
MPQQLSEQTLANLSDLLAANIGIHFPRERWNDLERGLGAAAHELGFKDARACSAGILAAPPARTELEILASHLTIGETYFFREPQSFEIVEHPILADLIRSRRSSNNPLLRIWSAGCATGEEPYSLAILLHRLLPDIEQWNISIMATDINPRFLQKAAAGVYAEWSFRGTPARLRERYFKAGPKGRYTVLPHIKRMVSFSYLNLAADIYPALTNGTNAMDLIFCRNVLMYFKSPTVKQVIGNLHRCLVDEGWLMVSAVETSHTLFAAFDPVSFQDLTCYRKPGTHPGHAPVTGWPGEAAPTKDNLGMTGPLVPATAIPLPSFAEGVLSVAERPPEIAATEPDPYAEACALYGQGRYNGAADKLTTRLTEAPQDIRALALMARTLANKGNFNEAAAWCEKAISSDKLDPGCHYLLATIQQEQGQFNDALTSLKRAVYLEPGFVLAYFTMGNLARLQGRAKASEKYFANALALLNTHQAEDILPESEGMTAQRLMEVIQAMEFPRAVTKRSNHEHQPG